MLFRSRFVFKFGYRYCSGSGLDIGLVDIESRKSSDDKLN